MKFFKSIRWRFQLWYGLLFTAMLSGFGFTAWEMEKASRFQEIDQELHQRISILTGELRPANPGPPGPQDGRPRPNDGRGPGPNDGRGPGPPRSNGGRREANQGYALDDPLGLGPGFGPEGGEGPNRRLTLRLTPTEENLFNGSGKENYYYVVWLHNGPSITRSVRAPEGVPEPEINNATVRQRGPYREAFFFTAPGDCMLVGRTIESDLPR